MKLKINLKFCYWENINEMIFDIKILLDDLIELEGVYFYDISKNQHIIDDQLIYMLNRKGIDDKIIISALNDKYYNFKILPKNEYGIEPILILS